MGKISQPYDVKDRPYEVRVFDHYDIKKLGNAKKGKKTIRDSDTDSCLTI